MHVAFWSIQVDTTELLTTGSCALRLMNRGDVSRDKMFEIYSVP